MNSGLAKSIRNKYPLVYNEYINYLKKDMLPLGMIQPVRVSPTLIVLNLFGQDSYGRDKRQTDYEALTLIANKLVVRNIKVCLPFGLGCGLGGGDWNIVKDIFKDINIIWYQHKKINDVLQSS